MKSRYLAAALCAVLPLAAGVALAQQGGRGAAESDGDGVERPAGFPLAAPKGVDSGAAKKGPAGAVNQAPFTVKGWKYGPRNDFPAGTPLFNPVMIKLRAGQQVFSATVNASSTPEAYCTQAKNPVNDFIWTEVQHSPYSWQNIANMWNACPGITGLGTGQSHAVPGARIPITSEEHFQHAGDMGAMIIVVPTIDDGAEARTAVKWTFFPPMGGHSSGSNVAGQQQWWGAAPGGYRAAYNRNMVLVLMIETLDGLANVDAIARTPGVTGIFAASGDLGNFTGYAQGDPDYERAINMVHDAALKAKIKLFGPSSWAARPDFDGFQGGPPGTGRGAGGRGRGARGAAAPAQ